MSILLNTANPFPSSINYGLSGTYTSRIRFSLSNASTSAVSSVTITSMTAGTTALIPHATFALSGVTLPVTVLNLDDSYTDYIGYTIVVNNNYLHASTEYAVISSALTATANVSAGTINSGTDSYVGTDFTGGVVVLSGDAGAPNPVSAVAAVGGDRVVTLTWNNPVDADWASTTVKYSLNTPASAIGIGTTVYSGVLSTVAVPVEALADTDVNYFGIYTTDNVAKTSTVVQASAVATWHNWTSNLEHARRYVQDEL